ncbi:butyrate kinase 2 [Clostridium acetireducens DSM 10703]|jgi:butyrate kinase|uniref:Probable butyrate kinase n=1 Tax=Clostridium acetireducens DSM 10703 TaxID=1121290 RepID=A0A1E8EXH9_9CLOT|nr:butyrate kinase [Clostridium acetireducens]OFI05504.1 butyrate kinase 2 [Clostridium acetireducens DSM 10703]
MNILVINPGGTSTKVSIFQDKKEIFKKNIKHTQDDLNDFKTVFEQYKYRKDLILNTLKENDLSINSFNCVVGRGGLMKAIKGGTYYVNEKMIEDLRNAISGEHASNLGAVLAKNIAEEINVPSFVVDPVSVDEFQDISRITGLSDIEKASWLHSLNHKAVCRKVAEEMGGKYEDYNFIVAHLGSGISIVAHNNGQMIDGSGGRSDGPFSPERSGGLLTYPLIKLCYSGKYTLEEMVNKVSNIGGMYDYLGTKDMIEIENMIENGDKKAKLIMDAFIYQVSKEISMYGASLLGKIDKIILTGGIAHSKLVTSKIANRISYMAPIKIIPGEMEMEALALGALRVLNGEEVAKIYN